MRSRWASNSLACEASVGGRGQRLQRGPVDLATQAISNEEFSNRCACRSARCPHYRPTVTSSLLASLESIAIDQYQTLSSSVSSLKLGDSPNGFRNLVSASFSTRAISIESDNESDQHKTSYNTTRRVKVNSKR